MLIAIEKPDSVAHAAEYMCLMDGDKFQRQHVEKEGKQPRWAVPEVIDIELVKSQRDASVEEHPHVELKLWCIGDLVRLLVHGDLFIKIPMVYVQNLQKPVACIPLRAIPQTPGGLHRILRVAHERSHVRK